MKLEHYNKLKKKMEGTLQEDMRVFLENGGVVTACNKGVMGDMSTVITFNNKKLKSKRIFNLSKNSREIKNP